MSQREPKRLPFSSLDEMIDQNYTIPGAKPYISNDLGIISNTNTYQALKKLFTPSLPYRVDDFRFIVFEEADVEVTANLRKYHITDNTLGFMGNGGIIQMDKVNKQVKMSGIVLKEDFLRLAMGGRLPTIFNGTQRNNYVQIENSKRVMLENMITMLRALVDEDGYSRETLSSMIATIINFVASLFERHGATQPVVQSRQQRVFEQFIDLVNTYCSRYHTLDFYADRLCITQRYLGTLVRQASGTTAKEWIDRAIINEAKVALKHSDVTVAQLADRLNFPNPSFFCKYFKRMTGLTPTEYQKK